MITNQEQIMDQMTGYLDPFDAILRHGHSVYDGYPSEVALEHDASTQAHCTYRHILAEAQRIFDDDGNVRHIEIRGLKLWLFENENVVVRFKKTDENGVSSNYPTKQARDFDRGNSLPGLPDQPTRLNAGYLLDDMGVGFERSQLALPIGRATLWCAAIIPQVDRDVDAAAWQDVTRQPRFQLG